MLHLYTPQSTSGRLLTRISLGLFLVVAFSCLTNHHAAAVTPGDWQAGNIIDDVVFYNDNSMSAEQVQQFLNAKVPVCDSQGTKSYAGTTRKAYSEARGISMPLICLKDYYENPSTHANNLNGQPVPSGGISAAQIIVNVSHQFTINPQVLLVLLQKEQGLVLDDWPWPSQYQTATGYGCPDSASCNSQYYGLYNQLYNAARQFRAYANAPNQYNYVPGQNNRILYNPSSSCGSSTVFIQNMATASLYNYTPYQPNQPAIASLYGTGDSCSAYGNRNFWTFFNDWFGSSITNAKWLRQSTANGQVYLVVEGQTANGSWDRKKWRLTSPDVYVAYGIQYQPVALVSENYLSQYDDDGTLGTLATSKSYAEFQFFDHGKRYYIPGINYCSKNIDGSTNTNTSWGFDCFNTNVVKTIPGNEFLEQIPGVGPVPPLLTNNNVTYKLQGGKKLPLYDNQTLLNLGYSASSTAQMEDINATQPLGSLVIGHSTVVSFNGGPFLLYNNADGQYYNVGTYDTLIAWGLHKVANPNPPTSAYNTTLPTVSGTVLSIWQTDGTHKYIIDNGRKIDVTTLASDMPTVTWQNLAPDILSTLPTALSGNYAWDNQTGAVYLLQNGQKRHVPSWDNFVGLGLTFPRLLPLNDSTLTQFPDGPDVLASGSLFQTNAGVFMVDGANSWHVPTYPFFKDFGLNVGDIDHNNNLGATYPSLGELSALISDSGSNRFLVNAGSRLGISSDAATNWGIAPSDYVQLGGGAINRLGSGKPLGRFFQHNGGVYYGSGGQKHYVQSFGTFVALGGDLANLPSVSDDFFNRLPTGSNIP